MLDVEDIIVQIQSFGCGQYAAISVRTDELLIVNRLIHIVLERNSGLHMCQNDSLSCACALCSQSVKVGLQEAFSCTYYAEDCSIYAAEEYKSDCAEADLDLRPDAIILKGPSQPDITGSYQALSALARDN